MTKLASKQLGLSTPVVLVTGSKTLALTDTGSVQSCSSAAPFTVTVPADASVAFAVGSSLNIIQEGVGIITIAQESGAINIRKPGSSFVTGHSTLGLYTRYLLQKIAANEWRLYKINTMPTAPVIQTVTIAAGFSLSPAVSLNSAFPVGLSVPVGWTAANITFQGSQDGGATYNNVRTAGGSEVTVNVTIAGDSYNLNPLDFALYTHIKIRSGATATPVNQVSSAAIVLSTRESLS